MIYIACDHGGPELKKAIKAHIESMGKSVTDLGTDSTESVDYPDYAIAVSERVAKEPGALGILVCRSGIGMSIVANKVKGIRCALCTSVDMGRLCREHNDANVLALGIGNTDFDTANKIVDAFLSSEFTGGRHAIRVNKIKAYEAKNG